MQLLDPQDHDRIARAIRAAEARTTGEIYCVVAHASAGYLLPAAAIMAAALLAASLAVAVALEWWWVSLRLPWFVLLQILSFGAGLLVLRLSPGLRIRLVPRSLLQARAHANAMRQFLSHNVHTTAERTGVLVFVSLAERHAEVIADSGIDRQVPADAWEGVVARLVEQAGSGHLADGFVAAVGTVGDLLAQHFPGRPADRNELEDRLVEI